MENRRSIKTQRALKKALIELIRQKDISKITVTDLTDLADLSRGTFYLHFKNPYDLLAEIENDVIRELAHLFDSLYGSSAGSNLLRYMEDSFAYIKENREIIRILMGPEALFTFLNKFRDFFIEKELANLRSRLDEREAEHLTYRSAYIVMGAIGIVQEWVKNDMNLSPQEMAEILYSNITRTGIIFPAGKQ